MDHPIFDNSTKVGTAGGTLLTIIVNITLLLKLLIKWFKK